MATILEFRTDGGRTRNRPMHLAKSATGQIVIFPGIRVSYWNDVLESHDDLPPAPQAASRQTKAPRRR